MQMIQNIILIGCGGAVGAVGRALVGEAASRAFGPGFPAGTLFVNAVGSFAMGVLMVLLLERVADPRLFVFLATGLLGGFTTFSAFSLDAAVLIQNDRHAAAAVYIAGSVGLSILFFFIGSLLVRSWTA